MVSKDKNALAWGRGTIEGAIDFPFNPIGTTMFRASA
jgi:hypothetical protein